MTDPEETSADIAELAGRLFTMARDGDAESLKIYLDAGVPVDLNNEAGDTLVMLAAYHGHPRTVRMLVGQGADVNRPNEKGQTPLAGAVFKGEDEVVRELVEGGADPHGGHPSAIDAARMFGREDYLVLLGK
ncbi:ankyrin repeat domain-containing protein [Rhodococcus sp. PAMC28707]|uniref:ankyrin repeat domain-containing protein n=1 Tax=unclassified Rhodococcus (in: high G+C Gram-positive bacteria) TaxID=192944 RepID=UPI00109E042E|nr:MULTISPECIES: ankyrin repeat domain-containing protein [unclassified Rhodococcus (in: high G+C Gram-positive bacteria)]QCB49571.1 ankyrin repeat domain-containing protein [Rhodococcus sp. PAMC28705]QCB58740.1 ankyrin repeat domain-containing protein [Rhodococcus sp. PAMC28707]